jgi:Type IV secretion system pilin
VARRLAVAALITLGLLVAAAPPAFAAGGPTLSGVISNLTNWIVGILAGVATLFLTIGGLRYLTAGGDPGQVEKAKIALKSAAIGYALAILAPLLVSILASLVGG